jgi:hypothetical protein
MRTVSLVVATLLVCSVVPAQRPTPSPNWDAWTFLIGKWVGEASSDIGEGVGLLGRGVVQSYFASHDSVVLEKGLASSPQQF